MSEIYNITAFAMHTIESFDITCLVHSAAKVMGGDDETFGDSRDG